MKNKLLLFLLLFIMIVIQTQAQSPTGTGIAITTTFTIPAGEAPANLNDATDYQFAVVSSDGLTLINSQTFHYNNATGNTISSIPLLNNTTYKWGVWSVGLDPTVVSPPNGIGFYTFTTAVLQVPTLAPATAYLTNGTGFTANWNSVTGATSYLLDVIVNTTSVYILHDQVVTGGATSYPVTSLTPAVAYFYRVRAVNTGGNSDYSATEVVQTISPPPTATSATSVTSTSFQANWVAASGATSYRIDVGTSSGATDVLYNQLVTGGTTTAYVVTSLTPGITYYYQVRTECLHGTSDNSNTITAITNSLQKPSLSSPTNNDVAISVVPTFIWSVGSLSGINNFEIEVATDNSFSNQFIVYTLATLPTSPLSFTLPDAKALGNGAQYYWRMRSVFSSLIKSDWSDGIFKFTTIASAMPYLSAPSNGAELSGTTTTFSWYTGQTGIQYALQIAADTPDFSSLVPFDPSFSSTVFTGTSFTVNNSMFSPGHTYYWRVISETIDLPTTPPTSPKIIDYSNTWQFSMPGLPQPTASYPIGNVSVFSNPPTLSWTCGSNAKVTEYWVGYAKKTTSSIPTIPTTMPTTCTADQGCFSTLSTTTSSIIPYALTPGATYYWEVASSDGTNNSGWSDKASFTIYGSTTFVICTPSFPIGGGAISTNPPTLSWTTNLFAPGLRYAVQYSKDPAFATTSTVITARPYPYTTSYSVPSPGLGAGHWYWRVAATFSSTDTVSISGGNWVKTNFGPWSASGDFSVTDNNTAASSPVPAPSSPTNGEVVASTNPTLSWFAYSPIPLQYQVVYSTDPNYDGTSGELDEGTLLTTGWMNSNSYITTGLTKGATYYWQVKSRLSTSIGVMSSWSTISYFTVSAGSASVVPLAGYPLNNTPISGTTTELSWVIPTTSSAPMTYSVQYGKKTDFSDAVSQSNLQAPSVTVSNLDKGTTYYWRAASVNTSGTSAYSSAGSFKTAGTTAVETKEALPARYALEQNYPNPFNPTTLINYSLPNNSFVVLKVYDMLGREIKTLVNNQMSAGKYSISWKGEDNNGNKVTSGIYIYRISAGNFTAARKMVVLK